MVRQPIGISSSFHETRTSLFSGARDHGLLEVTASSRSASSWRHCSSRDRCSNERTRCNRRQTSSRVRQAENGNIRPCSRLPDWHCPEPHVLLISDCLKSSTMRARPRGAWPLMLMDLDHFKEINDTLGHHFGDMLLQEIGAAAVGGAPDNDTDGPPRRRRVRDRASESAERGGRAAYRRPCARGAGAAGRG